MKNGKIEEEGRTEWYANGKLHRTGGPAVLWDDGYAEWRLNGELHRRNGPAIKYNNGTQVWYLYGKIHRLNGPAIERKDGKAEWYLHGVRTTKERVQRLYLNSKINFFLSIAKKLKQTLITAVSLSRTKSISNSLTTQAFPSRSGLEDIINDEPSLQEQLKIKLKNDLRSKGGRL